MKKKVATLIIICIVGIIIAILFQNSNFNNFKFETKDIVKVTIQHKNNKVTIEDTVDLNEFCNKFSDIKFALDKSAIGYKGWMYWIKCYDSNDKLIYDFTIQTEDIITYNNWFYMANESSIDYSYMMNIFEKSE